MVSERLGYYVYTLADPATGKVFYVGNRVSAHAKLPLRLRPPATSSTEFARFSLRTKAWATRSFATE
jgi:hypothetical protein